MPKRLSERFEKLRIVSFRRAVLFALAKLHRHVGQCLHPFLRSTSQAAARISDSHNMMNPKWLGFRLLLFVLAVYLAAGECRWALFSLRIKISSHAKPVRGLPEFATCIERGDNNVQQVIALDSRKDLVSYWTASA